MSQVKQLAVEDLGREIEALAMAAREASHRLAGLDSGTKNALLEEIARGLEAGQEEILAANLADVEEARLSGIGGALLDRLTLNERRIDDMVQGVREVKALPDPVGEIEGMWRRPNGLEVGRMRVPLGVVGMVFEARPNVTVDAAALCLKSGNALILRGGSEARRSIAVLAGILKQALRKCNLPEAAIGLVPVTDRAAVTFLARQDKYIDVLIARGGEELIHTLEREATVPLFKHGKGVCHTYVDARADLEKAAEIVFNAKVQRPGVCNAMETLLVHQEIAGAFLPGICARLREAGVELRGCEQARTLVPGMQPATEEDWAAEYLALILAVRVVPDLDAAIAHIRRYGSLHTEAIVTEDYPNAMRFLREVDASAVLVNASTRFNDGGQLGLGAEIGISTQKLHARGPLGLRELTSTKFVVLGNGQVRS